MSNNTESRTWNIDQIRAISEDEAKRLSSEHMTIKDHDVYFMDFGGYFGYSVLVYANHHHICYASDYEVHHPGKAHEQLKECYIKSLNNVLFTEAELIAPLASYEEYSRKDYFLSNHYSMRENYISIYFIGSDEERKAIKDRIKSEKMIYSPIARGYYANSCFQFAEKLILLYAELCKRRQEADNDFTFLKNAFLQEMWNHEYGYNSYQGNWDVLSCFGRIRYNDADDPIDYFDQLNFDDTHRQAYLAARKEYFKEFNSRDV